LLGLASSFHELDLTGSIDSVVSGPYHAILTADYVKNLGFNQAAVSERVGTPVSPETTGYLLRVLFGKPELKLRDDWQVFLTYKRVERDSVLDAFTDPDFHLGGTDAKGYVVGASYGLAKNTWATVRYFSTDAISGPPLSIDTLQFDIYTHF
jgi:outer membrane cobalamin receptor